MGQCAVDGRRRLRRCVHSPSSVPRISAAATQQPAHEETRKAWVGQVEPEGDVDPVPGAAAAGGWLFPGQVDGHLSPDYVGTLLRRLLGRGYSAHTLRHRFASRAYAGTRDLLAVQNLLGHSKPETTQRYIAPLSR